MQTKKIFQIMSINLLSGLITIHGIAQKPLLKIIQKHTAEINCMAISNNEKFLVSGSDDKTIKLWDIQTGKEIRTFTGHTHDVTSVAFSSDNQYIISGDLNYIVKLWDAATGKEIQSFNPYSEYLDYKPQVNTEPPYSKISFLNEDRYLLYGDVNDLTLRIWDIKTGELIPQFWAQYEYTSVISPDEKSLITTKWDLIERIDIKSGEVQQSMEITDYGLNVTCITLSPDGNYLICGYKGGIVRLWDLDNQNELQPLIGHANDVSALCITPDNQHIISGSKDGSLKLWDLKTGEELKVFSGHLEEIIFVSFINNCTQFISGDSDGEIKVWDIENGSDIKYLAGHKESVNSIDYSTDNKYMVTGSEDGVIILWDAQTGRELYSLYGHSGSINSVIFNPGNNYIISGSSDNTVKIWDIASGNEIRTLIGHSDKVNSVTVSPDNALIISASEDSTIFIWDFQTGEKVNTLKGHRDGVKTLSCSPDNKYLLSASMWGSVRLWDIQMGETIWEVPHHETLKIYGDYYINAINVTFSSDSRYAISAFDKIINIRDVKTGKLIQTIIGHYNSNLHDPFGTVNSVYSNRNYLIAAVTINIGSNPYDPLFLDLIKIWDIESGELIQTFSGLNRINPELVSISESGIEWPEKSNLTAFTISPDNKLLAYGDNKGSICLMDINCGYETLSFLDQEMSINTSLAYDLNNNTIINGTAEGYIKSWNLNYNEIRTCFRDNLPIESVSVNPDGRYILVLDHNRIIKLFDSQSGEQDPFNYLSIQPDYRQDIPDIVTSNNSLIGELGSYGIKIFDIKSGEIMAELRPVDYADFYYNTFSLLHFCKDNKHLIIGDAINDGILILDLDKGFTYRDFVSDLIYGNLKTNSIKYFARIDTLRPARETSSNNIQTGPGYPTSAVYNTEDGIVAVGYSDGMIIFWDIENGNKIETITQHTSQVVSLAYNSDHKYLASVCSGGTIIVTDLMKGGKVWELKGTENIKIDMYGSYYINDFPVDFIYNDKYIIAKGSDFDFRLWDAQTGDEIAKMMIPGQEDWIVSTPDGLFDASVNGMKYLYYVTGLEVIELDQMKGRYYEPGLLQKLLGLNEEPIRDVSAFNQVALYPSIELKEIDKNGNLDIHLINNGGGIGQVKIFINGKEITPDARGNNADPNASHLIVTEKIKDHPYLISGGDNVIEVKAYNTEGYLISRGVKVKYTQEEKDQVEYPGLFIVAAGVSDYTGTDIDLKYAAKDASDIAKAFEVGAKRLFGADKTYTYLLTTDQNEDILQPTKENLSRVFKEISGKANSTDLLIVYISGHGINWGGQDGDFYYLTKEAYTASTSAYNDPAIREVSGISSDAMVDMIKKIPALKQVLIIDACASGKVIENLMTQRSVSSTTLRALDRMKDRTGMHIITGCTANAVSYEASRYGQGVLTYSLLEGIRGAALRDDRFVDISLLFQNARDRVPELAEGIGGIQKPEIFSPYGSESFDIGELTTEDKFMIPLAQIKPVFIRSSFQDEDEFEDVLKLSSIIDERLNNISKEKNTLIYIDTGEFPESYKLVGRYKQENGSIILQLRIRSKDSSEQFTIQVNSTDELIVKVLDIVQEIDL